MASIFRLGSRQVLNQLLRNEKSGMLCALRPVTLQSKPPPPASTLGHDERNMKLGRPQSPHLTIYAPQMTSMLSISHRGTGMALAGYTILFSAAAIYLPDTIPSYIDALAEAKIGAAPLFIGKFALAFPLAYHFWNGIRHLMWDLGLFLSIKEVYATGTVMLAVAIGTGIGLCFL